MHSFITLRKLFIVCIVSAGFIACTRITATDVGSDLIPSIDGVITQDTLLDVITETFDSPDTARVGADDNFALGAITNDPLFGSTNARMFFQVSAPSYPFYIPGNRDSIAIDSAVLILGYAGSFGDSTQPLRLTVSEVAPSTPLIYNRGYPVNFPNVEPINIGFPLSAPTTIDIRRLSDSVYNRYEAAVNQIRIPLNTSFAVRMLRVYDSSSAYASDSAFKTYFNGFAITADQSAPSNALIKVSLADTNTKLALYYSSSSTGATTRDTSVAYFKFNALQDAFANFITRNRTGTEVTQHISTTTPKADSLVYVQTNPGTYVRIRIPGLQSLSNRLIHRAELIAEQVPDDAHPAIDQAMTAPRYLLLAVFDSLNNLKKNIPNDYILSTDGPNLASFGGYRTSKSINGYNGVAAYNFNVSRYVQGIVTRKDTSFTLRMLAPGNDSLYYKTPYPDVTAPAITYLTPTVGNDAADGRVRLGGGSHSRFRMRLRIIFSRI